MNLNDHLGNVPLFYGPFFNIGNDVLSISIVEKTVSKLKLLRINKDDFETIKALTRGQYGKVSIVRSRLDGGIYAMKTLNKMYILSQKDVSLYMNIINLWLSPTI